MEPMISLGRGTRACGNPGSFPGHAPVLLPGSSYLLGEPHVHLIGLLATNFDVKWVMSQVGHADSKMTMDVYAQLLDRHKRAHGAAFDSLLAKATGAPSGAPEEGFSPPFSPPPRFSPPLRSTDKSESAPFAGQTESGRAWFRTRDLSRVKRALSH